MSLEPQQRAPLTRHMNTSPGPRVSKSPFLTPVWVSYGKVAAPTMHLPVLEGHYAPPIPRRLLLGGGEVHLVLAEL